MERLWAYLTIQQLLKQKTAAQASSSSSSSVTEKVKSIEAEILEMALKYEFVTPLTAMVVTKPAPEETNSTRGNLIMMMMMMMIIIA